MELAQRTEQARRRLTALLAEDRPDAAGLVRYLRQLRDEEGVPSFSTALHILAHLNLPEVQAERLLADLLRHREDVTNALGRDPGIRVAAIDYLSNVTKLLANPTIVERSELEKTERSAITDALTGLFNRRHFMATLGLEVRRSERYALGLSLLMLDLDAFKVLNDEYGHLFGDLVLRRVGRVLRRTVREADIACRFGGEEFAVVLPETDRLGAYAVAERVRRGLERRFAEKKIGGRTIRVSLSGGIASYPEDGPDAAALVARADQALYLSKSRGKNQISLYHSERRGQIRYPGKLAARVSLARKGSELQRGSLRDVSRSGVLLELRERVPEGAGVELGFVGHDPAGGRLCWQRQGRVVRVERLDRPPATVFLVAVELAEMLAEDCLRQQVRRTRALRAVEGARA